MRSDEQLALAARGGDQAAFEELHRRCRFIMNANASMFFGPGLEHDDLLQVAAFGLYRAVHDWKPDAGVSFRSFASLCVKRQLITTVIWAKRMKYGPLNDGVSFETPVGDDDDLRLGDILPDRTSSPHRSLVARERLAAILDAIAHRLSDLEREALIRFVNGQTMEEIERVLEAQTGHKSIALHRDGRPRPKMTENAIDRARAKLAQAYDGDATPLGAAA